MHLYFEIFSQKLVYIADRLYDNSLHHHMLGIMHFKKVGRWLFFANIFRFCPFFLHGSFASSHPFIKTFFAKMICGHATQRIWVLYNLEKYYGEEEVEEPPICRAPDLTANDDSWCLHYSFLPDMKLKNLT